MRIAISGAQCTGKTTLICALKKEGVLLDHIYYDEVIRTLQKEKGIVFNKKADYDSQVLIFEKHLDNLRENNFVSDRCLLDAFVYSTYLFRKGLYSESEFYDFENLFLKGINQYDRIFLLSPEFILKGDGVRDIDPLFQREINEIFIEISLKFDIKIISLYGNTEDRIKNFKKSVYEKDKGCYKV